MCVAQPAPRARPSRAPPAAAAPVAARRCSTWPANTSEQDAHALDRERGKGEGLGARRSADVLLRSTNAHFLLLAAGGSCYS